MAGRRTASHGEYGPTLIQKIGARRATGDGHNIRVELDERGRFDMPPGQPAPYVAVAIFCFHERMLVSADDLVDRRREGFDLREKIDGV